MTVKHQQLDALKQEIPYKWKVQIAREWGCECVAYIDARQVMELLDEVVGPANWQDHYREVAGQVYCDLSIKADGEWVTKSDCGTASAFEAEKGQASDAFKRAAVKWGVGRFLYKMDTVRTKSMELSSDSQGRPRYVPCDDKGKRIYNLTAYIRALKANSTKKSAPPLENGVKMTPQQRDDLKALCKELGWKGVELNQYLKQHHMTWKTLTQEQAARVMNELELIRDMPQPDRDDELLLEDEGAFTF